MICIHHNKDLDGHSSGAIVKFKYPDATLIGYDNGQDAQPILDKLAELLAAGDKHIIITDISFKMPIMYKIAQMSNWDTTWIDHHKSAITAYDDYTKKYGTFLTTVLQDGIAACELTWKTMWPRTAIPEAIKLLGEYDTWRNQDADRWNNHVLPFQYGLRTICTSPETFPTDQLLGIDDEQTFELIEHIKGIGRIIIPYRDSVNEMVAKKISFDAKVFGLRGICLNTAESGSDLFKSIYDPDKHDIMVSFRYNGNKPDDKKWEFSLRAEKDTTDCSTIATMFDGGGHKGAAGFAVADLGLVFNKPV